MPNIIVIQISVDDIIFGTNEKSISREFGTLMQGEFEMSMMDELTFFLELQIKQSRPRIAICQAKYIRELLRNSKLSKAKHSKTPMSTSIKMDKNEKARSVDRKCHRGMIGSLLYLAASSQILYLLLAYVQDFSLTPTNLI